MGSYILSIVGKSGEGKGPSQLLAGAEMQPRQEWGISKPEDGTMELDTTPSKEIHLSLRLREGESFPEGHVAMKRKGQTFPKDSLLQRAGNRRSLNKDETSL